jgi:hypothetical protein
VLTMQEQQVDGRTADDEHEHHESGNGDAAAARVAVSRLDGEEAHLRLDGLQSDEMGTRCDGYGGEGRRTEARVRPVTKMQHVKKSGVGQMSDLGKGKNFGGLRCGPHHTQRRGAGPSWPPSGSVCLSV